MLHSQFNKLLTSLNIQGKDLAEYCGFSPSIISKLRSGNRAPEASSSTITKVVDGIIMWVNDNDSEDKLNSLLASEGMDSDYSSLHMAIILFLYNDSPEVVNNYTKPGMEAIDITHFSNKLSIITDMTNFSNIKLSKALNVDPSYISRFKNGERVPRSNSKLLNDMCQVLYERIQQKEKKPEVAKLIGLSGEECNDDAVLFPLFRDWLCDFNNNNVSIMQLLRSINSFSSMSVDLLPTYESIVNREVLNDKAEIYTGIAGIRQASERFLTSVIENDIREVWLYSDEPMNWIFDNDEFRMRWIILVTELVKRKVKIKIIHNIDRNISEMVDGIRSWMPLYLSGLIEPYYANTHLGNRFSHTLFIAPGLMAVSGLSVKEDEGIYHMFTTKDMVKEYENMFQTFLKDCSPLARIYQGDEYQHNNAFFLNGENLQNLRIALNARSVVIHKTNEPHMTFVFLHPLMRVAFKAFLNNVE